MLTFNAYLKFLGRISVVTLILAGFLVVFWTAGANTEKTFTLNKNEPDDLSSQNWQTPGSFHTLNNLNDDNGKLLIPVKIPGAGTKDDPYRISNIYQLQNITSGTSKYYILTNNIDASVTKNWDAGNGFDPIENFNGRLDGQGYYIKGLHINRSTRPQSGVFSVIQNRGRVENLGLKKIQVTGSTASGGLAGKNNGLIDQVFITGQVIGESETGSLVGHNDQGKIKNSYSLVDSSSRSGLPVNLVGVDQGQVVTSYDLESKEKESKVPDYESIEELILNILQENQEDDPKESQFPGSIFDQMVATSTEQPEQVWEFDQNAGRYRLDWETDDRKFDSGFYRISKPFSLASVKELVSSQINWEETTPENTEINIYTAITDSSQLHSLELNGRDEYFKIKDVPFGQTAFTLAGRIKLDQGHGPGKKNTFLWQGGKSDLPDGSRNALLVELDNSGEVKIEFDGQIFESQIETPEKWNHLTVSFDGRDLSFYQNKDKLFTQTAEENGTLSGQPLFFGAQKKDGGFDSEAYFSGKIDDVRFYDRALTSREVSYLSQNNLNRIPEPKHYWALNYGSGSRITDSAGSKHGDLTGGRWINDSGVFQEASPRQPIPGLKPGQNLSSKYLWLKQELKTDTPSISPELHSLSFSVEGVSTLIDSALRVKTSRSNFVSGIEVRKNGLIELIN